MRLIAHSRHVLEQLILVLLLECIIAVPIFLQLVFNCGLLRISLAIVAFRSIETERCG